METGLAIRDSKHLAQSMKVLLHTPVGSRVMRRDYGSGIPELLDRPLNADGKLDLYAAVATAVNRWEPRVSLSQVDVEEAGDDGQVTVALAGTDLTTGSSLSFVI